MDRELSMTTIHIRLPSKMVKGMDQLIGARKRSAFLMSLAEKELRKRSMLTALDRTFGAWSKESHPELRYGSIAFQKKLRKENEKRFHKLAR